MTRIKISVAVGASALWIATLFLQAKGEEMRRMVPVLIGFEGEKSLNVIRRNGGTVRFNYSIINAAAAYVPESAIDEISKSPGVKYVEMDRPISFASAPEEKAKPIKLPSGQQIPWGVERIGAVKAWAKSRGKGVKVAVLDSGIDYTHEDLVASYAGGIDLLDGDLDPMDDYGHGTMVAGVIAAADNDVGIIGVAPEACLYAVRVAGVVKDGAVVGDWATVVAGIDWCVRNGMQVINDIAGDWYNRTFESALKAAWDAGVVIIAPAGNQERHGWYFFSGYDGLVAHVGAADSRDKIAGFSSRGDWVDLCAPTGVLTTKLGGGYRTVRGTCSASPHVAGVAALILAAEPSLSNREVCARLFVTSERLAGGWRRAVRRLFVKPDKPSRQWWDENQGWGLVDAEKALNPPGPPNSILESITIVPSSAPGEVGFHRRFSAIGTYADSSQCNLTFDATWRSTNPSVAALFWDGRAKGLSVGRASLTASCGDVKSSRAMFTVKAASRDIVTIERALWVRNQKADRGILYVAATSTWGGSVTLTVRGQGWRTLEDYATMTYHKETGKHIFQRSLISCPYWIWVSSSGGGRSCAWPMTR